MTCISIKQSLLDQAMAAQGGSEGLARGGVLPGGYGCALWAQREGDGPTKTGKTFGRGRIVPDPVAVGHRMEDPEEQLRLPLALPSAACC